VPLKIWGGGNFAMQYMPCTSQRCDVVIRSVLR